MSAWIHVWSPQACGQLGVSGSKLPVSKLAKYVCWTMGNESSKSMDTRDMVTMLFIMSSASVVLVTISLFKQLEKSVMYTIL